MEIGELICGLVTPGRLASLRDAETIMLFSGGVASLNLRLMALSPPRTYGDKMVIFRTSISRIQLRNNRIDIINATSPWAAAGILQCGPETGVVGDAFELSQACVWRATF